MSILFGNEYEFLSSGQADYVCASFLDSSKFVVVYRDVSDSSHGTAKVGTVSGTTITFGEEAEFLSTGSTTWNTLSILDESQFVVGYRDGSDAGHGTAKVGTVSGTTITFGAESEFSSGGSTSQIQSIQLSGSKFVFIYRDVADGSHGTAKVGTVSGTTISFGAETEFVNSGVVIYLSISRLDSSKFVIAYTDSADANHGTAKIGTVSGTTITFGEEEEFAGGLITVFNEVAALNESKFIIAYQDITSGGHGLARIGTVSGTTITIGAATEFFSSGTASYLSVEKLTESQFAIMYSEDDNGDRGAAKIGTVSDTTIAFGEEAEFSSSSIFHSMAQFNGLQFLVAYRDQSDSDHGTVRIGNLIEESPVDLLAVGHQQMASFWHPENWKHRVR